MPGPRSPGLVATVPQLPDVAAVSPRNRRGDDDPPKRSGLTGRAGGVPGKRGGKTPPGKKPNASGYGRGEPPDPKGKGRKPR